MERFGPPGAVGQAVLEALQRLAHAALRPALNVAMRVMAERHQPVFDRLADFRDASILVEPTDQPIAFLLRFGPPHLIEVAGARASREATAIIRGPFKSLIGLLEGRLDADALFFSREISISGSTELVLAVRNAIDGQEINVLRDLTEAFGLPAEPTRRAVESGLRLAGAVGPLVTPFVRRLGTQDAVPSSSRRIAQRRRSF